jgi:hypothetical protein
MTSYRSESCVCVRGRLRHVQHLGTGALLARWVTLRLSVTQAWSQQLSVSNGTNWGITGSE